MELPKHIVAVEGLISNRKGMVLLVHNPDRGWQFPGGKVELGEDLITALKREVQEETGIVVSLGQLAGVYTNTRQQNANLPPMLLLVFLGKKIAGGPKTCEEVLDVGWFSRSAVLNMISHPAIHDRVKDMLCFSGKVVYRVYSTDPYKVHREFWL